MKNLLLTVILLCFCLPFVKAADQKMILISTNETDLILQVAPNGRLYQTYLGNKLVNESEFENLSWNTKPERMAAYQPVDGKYILAQERKIISNQLSPSSITTET